MEDFFDHLVGHNSVKLRLNKIISSGNIPHAFMFSGQKGVGKFAFALEVITHLNKSKKLSDKGIEQIKKLQKPYVEYIFPLPSGKNETNSDSAYSKLDDSQLEEITGEIKKKIENPYHPVSITKAQNIKINSIRDLKKYLSVDKSEIPYSAVIIDDAEKMSVEAQNSLLKSLEEPPEGIIFFLLVSDENLILDTIKSRTWYVNFSNLKEDEVEAILMKYTDASREEIIRIAPFAEGSVIKGLKILEIGAEVIDLVIDFIRQAVVGNTYSAAKVFDSLMEMTDSDFEIIMQMVIMWLSDANKEKMSGGNDERYYFDSDKITFKKFNKSFPKADFPKAISRLNELTALKKSNVSLKIILMNIIFVLNSLSRR